MYKIFHSPIKPPVIVETFDEVRVYVAMMRAIQKGTPAWEKCDDDFMKGANI